MIIYVVQSINYIPNKVIDRFIIFIRNFVHYFLIAYLLTGPSFGQEVVSNTLPVLSSIQSGNVNINSNNNVLNINQSSNKAIIDWKTFDVGSESTVNFNQPSASSSTLNKILSSDPSKIFGKLNATGEVIFQNYGGIYFGKNSRLDVGSITATTGNIRNEDYLNDNYKFDLTNSTGNIENLGEINAFENYVALLSPEVRNSGLIVAEKTAVLGSGNEVTLNFINGGTLHSITTTENNVDTLVENKSAIEVPGGLIIISVKAKSSLVSSIINQEGILSTKQADQVVKKDGRVYLQASTINLSNNSEIIASGNDAGGLINLSATDISIKENSIIDASGEIAGKIELNSTKGNLNLTNSTLKASSNENDGGKIIVASTENIIIENSTIEARGLNNGGQILIGNDYLEKTIPIAKSTILDINTILNVSSFDTEQGIGGLIETSGLKLVTNASIQAGEGGSWIIDPFDIIIDDTTAGYINTALTAGTSVTLTTATETNDINNDPVNTITGSSGEGDITLNSAITSSGNGSLTLIAADDIYINAAISLSGTNNQVTLTAADIVYLGASITTTGNQTINANVDIQGSSTLNSGLANITINGNVTASNGILAFLGDGDYLYNGTSYTVDGTEPIGILYDAASDTYKWQATVTTAEALIVAGGGGGGMDIGGGGGGGGVIAQDITLTPGWIDVKVGDGGAGAPSGGTGSGTQGRNDHVWTINAKQGENSSIVTVNGTLTAIGGGYGGTGPWNHTLQGQAGSGGSGGGASGYNAGTSGRNGSATAGQGNAGASGNNHHVGGGGGGAGGTGSTGRSNYASKGGDGIENCILGTCYYWAGGGGAAGHSYFGGHGGRGGGGGGGSYNSGGTVIAGADGLNTGTVGGVGRNKPGGDGGVNTGGGGGGSTHYNATNKGGDGGSGIVVVKYQEALTLIGASINVTGNITDTSLTVTNTANSEIAGVVSGSTGLTKSGSGVLTMSGDSTYTGVTTISAGTLQTTGTLGNTDISISSGATYDVDATDTIGSIGGAGAINIATSQTLTTSTSSNTTVSGVISGAGTLEKAGTGTLTLTGSNDYTGGTSFAGGTVSLGSANAISTSGTLSFSGGAIQSTASNTTDYSSRFNTGSSQAFKIDTNGQDITWASNLENTNSSITKTGTGTLTVSGNVGVTGDDSFVSPNINISAGTFVSSGTIHSIGTLTGGASTTLTLSSSPSITTLALSDGVTMTIPVLTVSGTSSIGGTITTQGDISLTGASTLAGNTTLTSNDNDVTFGSTINGEYTLTVAAGTGSASFGGTIGDSAAIKKLSVVASGGITLTGSISTVMGLNDGLYFQKFDGNYGNNVQNLSNRTEQVIRASEVAGAPGNQKGIVATTIAICTSHGCDETYTYRVIGYFKPQQTGSHHFYSLADDPTHLYMGTSGQSIDEFVTQVESTSSYNKTGRVLSLTGCCSWVNGTVTLTAGNLYPMYHVFSENGGGDYSYLRWKNPDGAWVSLKNSDRASDGTGYYFTSGAVGGGGGGVDTGVYLTGNVNIAADTTITSANATINVTGNISSSSGKDLIVDSSTFDADNISNLDVLTIKSSTATVGTLDTINTATIESGSYTGNAISSVDALEIQSNTLSVTGNIETDTSLTFNSSSNLSVANVITGTGQLIKSNTNQLTLTGTNNFTGGVNLSAGTLALNSAAAIGSSGTVVLGGGTLKYSSSNTTDYSSRFSTANDQKYNIDTNSQSITFANNLTSSGGILTKTGNGTLTLSGTNTYTGGTNISGGSILLNSAGAIGSTGTLLFNGGTLVYSANNTTDYSSRFSTAASQNFNINTSGQDISYSTRLASSSGTLTKSGTGSLTLAGANTYNGLTTVSAGTLVSNGTINGDLSISSGATFDLNQTDTIGSLTGSGTIDIASAKVLTLSSSSNSTFSGIISGGGQLKKSGSGTLILSGTNTYTGGTNFNGGTLQLSSSGALGSSGDLTFSGGILKYTSSNNNDYSSRLDSSSSQNFKIDTNSQNVTWASNFVNDNSTFVKSGSGTLTLSGDFGLTDESFTATNVTISGGTLSLPNTVNSIGSINLQGGGINCPSCPSLGDFVATAGSTLTFNAAVFDSLTLASGVTVNASSITVNNTSSLGGDITTTGPMSFGGAVTLVANTNLISTNNSITFNSTINGTKELSVNAGTSTAGFNGAIGGSTKLAKLTVVASGGITINNVSIKGLSDGLYFQKFDGVYGNNTQNLSNRTEQVIRSTEVSGAPGNVKGIVADHIAICTRGNCDETYTYKITGYFIPQQTGTHNFHLLGDDANHLYLGTAGQSLTEYETYVESISSVNKTGYVVGLTGCCSWRNGNVNLTAGEQYPIYTVFSENGGGDYLYMRWKNPDGAWVALQNSDRTSNGSGYFFTERDASGSGSSNSGIYLTGDVTVASNATFDAAKGIVNITGDISGSTSTDFTINSKSVELDSITEFAALNIEVTNDSKVDGVISGTNVAFKKKGDGKLTLTKENTFTGSTNIIGGTILLDNGAIVGDDGEPTGVVNYGSLGNVYNPLTIGSGTLTIKDRDMTFYGLTMGANSVINTSSSSSITLPSNNLAGDLTSYTLGGSITTSGTQTFSGAISLAGDLSLTSGNQAINFTQDAALTGNNNDLTINSGSGTTTFINPMSGLGTLSSTGTTIINSNEISSAGTQTYGALTFGGDLKLVTTNSNINFNSTITGTGQLEASVGTGTVYFKDKVGSNNIDTTLSSLTVTGKSYVAADVFTVNNQIYSSDMNVNGSINLTSLSGDITLNGDITAVGSAIMALLGEGNFLLNGQSYDLTSDSAAGTLAGLSYDTSSEKYTWTAASTSAETLIVAGGGGGGMDIGGGGGGGGVIAQNVVLVKGTNYLISVGDGGAGAPTGGTGSGTQGRNNHVWTINAKQGENSTFETANGTLTAIGGGYGGTGPWNHTLQGQAGSGGSGGGASGYNAGTSGTKWFGNCWSR
jgi:fibronectin-binding autotransporter adhesin